jgi:Mg-chelatase subunit ChlD
MTLGIGGGWYHWEDKQRALRLLIRRLETQNSILCNRDVFHYLKSEGKTAPVAWSGDDADIHFNSSRLPSAETREEVIFVTGVNNHEVAHILFSPTVQDMRDLWSDPWSNPMVEMFLHNEMYQKIWNILDDQRIEMLMCRRFANMRPYFISAFSRIVLVDGRDHLDTAYLLSRGRRYLPIRVRRLLKRKFKDKAAIPDIRRIIDEYITLNTFKSRDLKRSHELILEMIKLIEDNGLFPQGAPSHEGCEQSSTMKRIDEERRESMRSYDPEERKPPKTRADKIDKDQIDEELEDVREQVEQQNAGQADDDSDGSEADGAGTGQGAGGSGGSDGSGDAEDTGSDSSGNSAAGLGDGNTPSDAEVAAGINAAVQEVVEASNLDEDARQALNYIKFSNDLAVPRVQDRAPVESELRSLARQTEKALRLKESEVDPYWDRGTNSGKLNIMRVMRRPEDRDHAFDRWEEGGYGGVDQEWVVLLDCSGSMKYQLITLSKAAWVMKRAADIVEAKMTVMIYGGTNSQQLAYSPATRANVAERPQFPDLGGTDPSHALLEAYRVLSQSKRAMKGLFIMTDGDWGQRGTTGIPGLETSEKIIEALNRMGVQTHLAFVQGMYTATMNAHKCKTAAPCPSVEDLPQTMKDLIAGRIQKTK